MSFARESVEQRKQEAPLHSLMDLLNAAQAFEAGEVLEDEALARLFEAGSTPGGARPKALMHDDQGYQLTPAYDLAPNLAQNREHVLRFGLTALPPAKGELVQIAKQYNLQSRQAIAVIDTVVNAVSQWKQVFAGYEVPHHDVMRLRKDIEVRVGRF